MNTTLVTAIFKLGILPTAFLFGIGTPAAFVAKHYQDEDNRAHALCNQLMMSSCSFEDVEGLKQRFYCMAEDKTWKFKIPNEEALSSVINIFENSKIIYGISRKIMHCWDFIHSGPCGDIKKIKAHFMLGDSPLNSLLEFAQRYIKSYGFSFKCDRESLGSLICKCNAARSYKNEILNLCDRDIETVIQSYKKMLQGLKKLKLIKNINKGVEIGLRL